MLGRPLVSCSIGPADTSIDGLRPRTALLSMWVLYGTCAISRLTKVERLRIKDAFERIAAVSHGLFPIGGCKMVTGLANEREKSQNLQRQSKDRTRV